MISESFTEIYFSIISALIFGLIFSALINIFSLFSILIRSLIYNLRRNILNKITIRDAYKSAIFSPKSEGRVGMFLRIVFLALGFSLLSYFALDGELRLYMVIIYSAVIFVSNIVFLCVSKLIFPPLFLLFFLPMRFILRLIALPSKHIFVFLKEKTKGIFGLFKRKLRFKSK